jgi:hypothetical protein
MPQRERSMINLQDRVCEVAAQGGRIGVHLQHPVAARRRQNVRRSEEANTVAKEVRTVDDPPDPAVLATARQPDAPPNWATSG